MGIRMLALSGAVGPQSWGPGEGLFHGVARELLSSAKAPQSPGPEGGCFPIQREGRAHGSSVGLGTLGMWALRTEENGRPADILSIPMD